MKEIPNMDELLNSFIDGELPAGEQTEIQRLIAHDEKVAQRLRQLEASRKLLRSLPIAEAPPHVLENVKASLARRTLLDEESSTFNEETGAKHLLGRRVLAAAAMVGLVGVLFFVIYSIVAPPTSTQEPLIVERRELPPRVEEIIEPQPAMVITPFDGRLELRTNNLPAVVAAINRAIEENIPSDEWIASEWSEVREPHTLVCSRESFELLLADLSNIWGRLSSATLFINTEVFGEEVVVGAVTTEQIAEIVNQSDSNERFEVAKDIAVLNNVSEYLPEREILAAFEDTSARLITPPKPPMTGPGRTTAGTDSDKNVYLRIMVLDSD
ncbi:MAG: hypothetical protein PVH77_11560 [Phycisphaerales bacterium]|jgi:hypothetical protein